MDELVTDSIESTGDVVKVRDDVHITGDLTVPEGNVGIGTPSPSSQLDVNGNAIFSGTVGVGTSSPDPSAALDISSTSGGFVIPRMTTTQRDSITAPTQSLMVYNLTTKCLQIWENSKWSNMWCDWDGVCGENTVIDVTNESTGEIWMDRNLGAARRAFAYNDPQAYGALFQWGRLSDGHECVNWTSYTSGTPVNDTTHTTSTSDDPGHILFIVNSISSGDWRISQNDELWQGVAGINNPCPPGYRLPTSLELENECLSWSNLDMDGAFESPLKFVVAGFSINAIGMFANVGSFGYGWSSTGSGSEARALSFHIGNAYLLYGFRGYVYSVRCIKD